MLQRIGCVLIIILTLTAVYLGSYTARIGEITYNADVARDFLLLNELDQDPIMLIGQRSDYKGLFHGPAWLYLNFPAYVIGNGNPVAISWWWIALSIGFAGLNYWAAKELFDKEAAFYFTALFTVLTMHYVDHFYNPVGGMLISSLFIYFACLYIKTYKLKYMVGQLILAGLILHFQLAVGIPTFILSVLALLYLIFKHKNYKHLLGFLAAFIPTANFILFEIKFGFPQINGVINHFNGTVEYYSLAFSEKVQDRIDRLFSAGSGFFFGKFGHYSKWVVMLVGLLLGKLFLLDKSPKSKKDERKMIFAVILYYVLGFYLLSFIHNGYVLVHYYLPFAPLVLLMFAGLNKYVDRRVFILLIIIILTINVSHLNDQNKEMLEKKNKDITSWTFMSNLTSTIPEMAGEKEVGVFVYAPDAYAYGPKYAVLYEKKRASISIAINEKEHETFLLFEPPPEEQPWLNGSYWKTDLLGINGEPVETKTFENGYRIEKYILNNDQLSIPIDPLALDWVSQR